MTLQEQYETTKAELSRLTQGTEEFMIKLAELSNIERELENVDRKDN
jgi:hypothetical protein